MSIQSKSLEETIAIIKQEEPFEPSFHLHLGSFNVNEPYEDKEAYKSLKWVIENQNLKLKKVTWGDTTGLKVKINDPKARKSFAARHKCDTRNDKTTASYWACRLPRYGKELGLSVDNPSGFW